MPGPVPNRESDLARPRDRKGSNEQAVKRGVALPTNPPAPHAAWHPIAQLIYKSLSTSGQSSFYQDSDWAVAYALCDDIDVYKRSGRRSAQMAAVIYSTLGSLLMTEADRRRVRIELDAPEPEQKPAAVLALADYRSNDDFDEGDGDSE